MLARQMLANASLLALIASPALAQSNPTLGPNTKIGVTGLLVGAGAGSAVKAAVAADINSTLGTGGLAINSLPQFNTPGSECKTPQAGSGLFSCDSMRAQVNTWTGPQTFVSAVVSSGSTAGLQAIDRSTSGNATLYRNGGVSRLYDSAAGDVITYGPTVPGGAAIFNNPILPHVANNAAIAALGPGVFPSFVRDGFLTPGDGGWAVYRSTSAPCPLNGGAGDGGSQIGFKSGGSSYTGCALVDPASVGPSFPIELWGGSNNDSTDSQPALAAAAAYLAAAGGGDVRLGATTGCYLIKSGVAVAANRVGIVGPAGQTCIDLGFATGPGITLGGSAGTNYLNNALRHVHFKHSTNRTSGADVQLYNTSFTTLDDLSFGDKSDGHYNDASIAIDYNTVFATLDNPQCQGEGNACVRIGQNSGATISANITINGGNAQYQHVAALDLSEVSGLVVGGGFNTDFNVHGLYAHPGLGQQVGGLYFTNPFLDLSFAETAVLDDSAGGQIIDNVFKGTWLASSGATPNTSATPANGGAPTNLGSYGTAPSAGCFVLGSGMKASASIAGTTLSIGGAVVSSGVTSPGILAIGDVVTGPGVADGTRIVGGSGTSWTVNKSQTVSSAVLYFTRVIDNDLDVHAFACGGHGVDLRGASNTRIQGVLANNSGNSNNAGNGLNVGVYVNHWSFFGRSGGTTGTNSDNQQGYGVAAAAGSDYYVVGGDLTGNVTGSFGNNNATHANTTGMLQ